MITGISLIKEKGWKMIDKDDYYILEQCEG
jgi:hypothetical protein